MWLLIKGGKKMKEKRYECLMVGVMNDNLTVWTERTAYVMAEKRSDAVKYAEEIYPNKDFRFSGLKYSKPRWQEIFDTDYSRHIDLVFLEELDDDVDTIDQKEICRQEHMGYLLND